MAANQSKEWFEANRADYLAHYQAPCIALAEAVAAVFAERGLPLTGDAKKSTFRIHRDVRFSKDKSPYKTHAGVVWTRPGGKKDGAGVLYLHLADEGCFLAAGFYGPVPPQLAALRDAIRDDPAGLTDAVAAAGAAGFAFDTSDSLVRMPRGYEAVDDPAIIPAIKARNLLVRRAVTKRETGRRLAGLVVAAAEAVLPFLQFGWDAVDEAAPEWSRLA